MQNYPCPVCHETANLDTGCAGCGRPPDRDAAAVIELNARIPALVASVEQTGRAYAQACAALADAERRRADLTARIRAAVWAARLSSQAQSGPVPAPPAARVAAGTGAPRPAETSTRTLQTLLFVLGGLLLGSAAIVFTAVAWAAFGVGGRATILGTVTVLALAVPPLALRRRLTGTAETFAALGLLLVALDGYAAWYVNLFGVAGGVPSRYAAAVCVVVTGTAAGYGVASRLRGPRVIAVLSGQPVLPLLFAAADPGPTGWALILAAVTAVDLALVRWRMATPRQDLPLRVVTWLAFGSGLVAAGSTAILAVAVAGGAAGTAAAGGTLVLAALLALGGAMVIGTAPVLATAGALVVLAAALAGGRLAVEIRPASATVLLAAVGAVLAAGVAATGRWVRPAVRIGPQAAALAVVGLGSVVTAIPALLIAAGTAGRAWPPWHADPATTGVVRDGQLAPAVALFAAGLVVLGPELVRAIREVRFAGTAPARPQPPLAAGVQPVGSAVSPSALRFMLALAAVPPVVFAMPAAVPLPWWAPSVLDLLAAFGLAVLAVSGRTPARRPASAGPPVVAGLAAVALTVHGVVAGLARPAGTAALLSGLVAAGIAVAAVARRASTAGGWPRYRRLVGGGALAAAVLAWPVALASALAAFGVPPWWVARATLGAFVPLVAAVAVLRRVWRVYRPYVLACGGAVVLAPVWSSLGSTAEPSAVYAAASLLALAALVLAAAPVRATAQRALWLVAALPGLWLVLAVLPAVAAVLVWPYAWLGDIWSGTPAGSGLPGWVGRVPGTDAVALGIAAVALALGTGARAMPTEAGTTAGRPHLALLARRGGPPAARTAGPVAATALLTALAAGPAPWPALPAASLLLGVSAALAAALHGRTATDLGLGIAAGAVFAGAGLAGALPTRATTLGALGLLMATGAAAGAAGRTVIVRTGGWLSATGVGVLLGLAAGLAGGLARPATGYPVLGVAAAALATGAALRGRGRSIEAAAVDAGAQAAALTALALTAGASRHAAVLSVLWGVALGLRALWPATPVSLRRAYATAGALAELLAWWLLLHAESVSLVEAYTLPAAAVALLAGWLVLRGHPALSSWVVYGPALAAALLPSLAPLLLGEDLPARRLILGIGSLGVLLAGTATRRQAPVLLGGGVLAAVAVHEVVLVWDLLPRWLPLAAGGLLLVGVAMTLERRRRDLTRLRDAIGRMT